MEPRDLPPEAPASREVLWQQALIRASLQGLEDVATADAAEVLFARSRRPATAGAFFDQLGEAALARGFAVARVSVLEERAFDTLDGLVRNLLLSLRAPGTSSRARGWAAVLDRFAAAHPSAAAAVAAFEHAARRFGAAGDLSVLSREYLDAGPRPARVAARLDAWTSGTELTRVEGRVTALTSLTSLTARRALGEFTRLLRALGHHGLLMVFEGAEVLTRLSPARRDGSFTVLRELIDNADGGRGLVAAQLWVSGTAALFDGPRAITAFRPLATRVLVTSTFDGTFPPPHRALVDLTPVGDWDPGGVLPTVRPPPPEAASALRAVMRASHGLPPADPEVSMSVGHERIDATITELFHHAALESSVFALVTGVYGAGKSHLLMHLTARALAERRPVFRLAMEHLDADLGNPQRHLRRMLDQAVLPLPAAPSALDRLVAWTRSAVGVYDLLAALEDIAVTTTGDAAIAARKALSRASRHAGAGVALESFLGAADLAARVGTSTYRKDAYQRLQLWLELLARMDDCRGPMILIDEAENLYRGLSSPQRRAALRSLSFYCGGTLPGSCVVLAITPDALTSLRQEAGELLADVTEQRTVLPSEDAAMLRRRITWTRPVEVPELDAGQRVVLAFRVRATHARVRGEVDDPRWASWVTGALSDAATPRELVRRVIDRLEGLWWRAGAAPTAHMFLNQS